MFSRQPSHTTPSHERHMRSVNIINIINIMQRHSDGLRTPSNWSKRTLQLEKKPGPKEFVLPWIILQINKDVKTPLPPWGTFCNLRQPHMSLPSFLSHTLRMLGVYFRLSQGHRLSLGWMFRSKQGPPQWPLRVGGGHVWWTLSVQRMWFTNSSETSTSKQSKPAPFFSVCVTWAYRSQATVGHRCGHTRFYVRALQSIF